MITKGVGDTAQGTYSHIETVLLCNADWLGTCSVVQAGLTLTELPLYPKIGRAAPCPALFDFYI